MFTFYLVIFSFQIKAACRCLFHIMFWCVQTYQRRPLRVARSRFDARKHVYGIFKINCFLLLMDRHVTCLWRHDSMSPVLWPADKIQASCRFVCLFVCYCCFCFFMFLNGKEKMLGWHWNWIILLCFLTDWVVTQRFFPTNAWQPTTILSVRRFLGEISSPLAP